MPRRKFDFYVYIMTSSSGTLYVGVTNNLARRVSEHKEGKIKGFTEKYSCKKLVFVEHHQYVYNAIEREKEIKSWMRYKKEELIKSTNPDWKDLSDQL
ncbi:MAG: GIY-YIG nuclease family protein [Candidatus Paceibacterota bacterium]